MAPEEIVFSDDFFNDVVGQNNPKPMSGGAFSDVLLNLNKNGTYVLRALPVYEVTKPDLWRPIGTHFVKLSNPDRNLMVIQCPEVTFPENGESCGLCAAGRELISDGKLSWEDVFGYGKWGVQIKYLLRILLFQFIPENKNDPTINFDPPVFRNAVVPKSVREAIEGKISAKIDISVGKKSGKDPRERAWKSIFGAKDGHFLVVKRSPKIQGYYQVDVHEDVYAIPDERLDPANWPKITSGLRFIKGVEIDELLTKAKEDIPIELAHWMGLVDVPPKVSEGPPPELSPAEIEGQASPPSHPFPKLDEKDMESAFGDSSPSIDDLESRLANM